MDPNEYIRWAEYYDLDPRNLYVADIEFYQQRAERLNGAVLELGCGTGRVAIPLAQRGTSVTGLDHSPSMLRVFERKLAVTDAPWRNNLHLVQGDMAAFSLGRTFGLIFIPFRSFQALTTRVDQLSCLRHVRDHLTADGTFIVDVFFPKQTLDDSWLRPRQEDWTTIIPGTQRRLTRYSTYRAIDVQRQILDVEMTFEISDASGLVDSFTEPLRLAYYYPRQIVALLNEAGLRVVETLGNYDGTPLGQGPEIILVCQKST